MKNTLALFVYDRQGHAAAALAQTAGPTATGSNLIENADHSDPVLAEAIDWLLQLQAEPGDPEIENEFQCWLSRSPRHEAAWARARRSWQVMGAVEPAYRHLWDRDAAMPKPTPAAATAAATRRPAQLASAGRRRPGWRIWTAGAITAIAATLLLALALPTILLHLKADHITATAEARTIRLEDGSTVAMGADTAIRSDFGARERRVTLLAGEAYFDVTPDAKRPFVVEAADASVTVLGTAFNLRLSSHETTVELAHGAVEFAGEAAGRSPRVGLAPGEMARFDRDSGTIATAPIALNDIGAWRGGYLFVNDAPISEVVEQLQRYEAAWITLPDPTLAEQRVTGLYDLRDPDRALRALVQPHGGQVRSVGSFLRVLSRY